MNVLVITSRDEARHHNVNPATCHHRSTPEVLFWWPTLGTECLLGRQFDMVIKDKKLHLTGEQLTWLWAHACRQRETLYVEASEIGGSILLDTYGLAS